MRLGPHKSLHGEREFVSEEMLDFCRQGYWVVLPLHAFAAWSLPTHLLPGDGPSA
jgi:hypothetical protein